jgi:hypothetical protein
MSQIYERTSARNRTSDDDAIHLLLRRALERPPEKLSAAAVVAGDGAGQPWVPDFPDFLRRRSVPSSSAPRQEQTNA